MMAGILDCGPNVIAARTHAIIDNIHAGANFLVAAMFSKRNRRRAAKGTFALRTGVLANALMPERTAATMRRFFFDIYRQLRQIRLSNCENGILRFSLLLLLQ